MLKATLKRGTIIPLEPVPADWEEGATLEIAKIDQPIDIGAWARMMNELCADSDPEEEQSMRTAIAEHRKQAKAQVRREMGLPE